MMCKGSLPENIIKFNDGAVKTNDLLVSVAIIVQDTALKCNRLLFSPVIRPFTVRR